EIPLHDLQVQESTANAAPTDLRVFRTLGPSTLHVGDSWALQAQAAGGQGNVHFKWTATSGSLSVGEGESVTWTATEPVGLAEIGVAAVDAGGNSLTGGLGGAVPFSQAAGIVEDVRDSVGYYCSLVLDGSNQPLIAYADITHPSLKFARYNGTSWTIDLVEG